MSALITVNVILARAAAVAGKRMRYRALVSSFEACLRVVHANLGIAIIPKEVLSSHGSGHDLKVIALTDSWAQRRFVICRRDGESLPKAAAMLVDNLEQAAQK